MTERSSCIKSRPDGAIDEARLPALRTGFEAALREAAQYLGATSPNPAVGCALLDAQDRILVVEAHHRAGTYHAEARALERARALGVLHKAVTALVTLEPCNHTGRTPPCSEALRASPVGEVWIGARDPNPEAGGGAARLSTMPGGKTVVMLESCRALSDIHQSCKALLAPFAERITRGRAWITVKQALDGRGSMIPPQGQKTFTSEASLLLAHRLRRATDAIVTGIGTVLADAPMLTVRRVADHDGPPRRMVVVCDRKGRLPSSWRSTLEGNGYRVVVSRSLEEVPSLLAGHGVNWAMVEAGPGLLEALDRHGLWNDWLTLRAGTSGNDTVSARISARAQGVTPLRFLLNDGFSSVSSSEAEF